MIKDFKHKGLEAFFLTGKKSGIQPKHAVKLSMRLALLNVATYIEDLDQDGYNLHRLKGARKSC